MTNDARFISRPDRSTCLGERHPLPCCRRCIGSGFVGQTAILQIAQSMQIDDANQAKIDSVDNASVSLTNFSRRFARYN
jgi:hypothetical protein